MTILIVGTDIFSQTSKYLAQLKEHMKTGSIVLVQYLYSLPQINLRLFYFVLMASRGT